jgi:hypothetical protein
MLHMKEVLHVMWMVSKMQEVDFLILLLLLHPLLLDHRYVLRHILLPLLRHHHRLQYLHLHFVRLL